MGSLGSSRMQTRGAQLPLAGTAEPYGASQRSRSSICLPHLPGGPSRPGPVASPPRSHSTVCAFTPHLSMEPFMAGSAEQIWWIGPRRRKEGVSPANSLGGRHPPSLGTSPAWPGLVQPVVEWPLASHPRHFWERPRVWNELGEGGEAGSGFPRRGLVGGWGSTGGGRYSPWAKAAAGFSAS